MATHSIVLARRLPGTGEPGGLPSMGSHRVGHDWSDLAAAAAAVNTESLTRLISFCSLSLPPFFSSNSTYLSKSGLHLKLFSSSVQFLSPVRLFVTLWTAAHQASLFINSWSLLKLMSIKSVMPSNHLILCRPLLLQPSIFPRIRVFSNQSVLRIRWPKYWSFSFSISASDEYSGLISFRIDWLDFLAVQGTLSSLLQQHCSKASVLQGSTLFVVQLSHPYVTTGKTIALTRWTFVGKVMSLLFNMLSRLVIVFLPRSKHLFISWLQSTSAVILEPPKIKSLSERLSHLNAN